MKVSGSGIQPHDGSGGHIPLQRGQAADHSPWRKGDRITLHKPETLLLASMSQDTDGNNRPGEFIGPPSQSTLGEKQVEDQWGKGRGVVSNGLAGRGLKGG